MGMLVKMAATVLFLLPLSCQTKQEGIIEGTVVPPAATTTVTALRDGRAVKTIQTTSDGRFTLALTPGGYRITAAGGGEESAVRRAIDNVTVRPGETIFLPPIELALAKGTAVLAGRIFATKPGSEVSLYEDGVERASVRSDDEGRYQFQELAPGTYTIKARLLGHAADEARIVIAGNGTVEQNARLFPVIPLDGVDWEAGKIRATGIGMPPPEAANGTARRALAQRAALVDGQRNLLRIIEQLRLDNGRTVKEAMTGSVATQRIEGFLRGYAIVGERDLPNGGVEVKLELPLNGPEGLSRLFSE